MESTQAVTHTHIHTYTHTHIPTIKGSSRREREERKKEREREGEERTREKKKKERRERARAKSQVFYLDRRVFMPSYDPSVDDDKGTYLEGVLAPALVVCSGINLELVTAIGD